MCAEGYVAELDEAFFADPVRGERLKALVEAVSQASSREEAQVASAEIAVLQEEALVELNARRAERGLPPYLPQSPQL